MRKYRAFFKAGVLIAALCVSFLVVFNSCKEEIIPEIPSLTTDLLSGLTATSVNYTFTISADNGGAITECGVCWDTLPYPLVSDNKKMHEAGVGTFSGELAELASNTDFYIRAYAINSAGVAYGNTLEFKTITSYYFGFMSDIDGNEYEAIYVGDKVWMAENLRTTKFKNGASIEIHGVSTNWSNTEDPAYCYYNGQWSNVAKYGMLYNYNAVASGDLCPEGWHIPSSSEWQAMIDYLIANGYNYDGTTVGNKYAKSISSTSMWETYHETGTVGNNSFLNNKAGFNAVPAGIRGSNGNYNSEAFTTSFWSSTSINSTYSYSYDLHYSNTSLIENETNRKMGLSVRCVKD